MKQPLLRVHPDAIREVRAARQWYAAHSVQAAEEFIVELRKAVQNVIEAPSRWPMYSSSTHKYRLHRFPYSIIYRKSQTSIQIIAVAHGHRRPGYWKQRISS